MPLRTCVALALLTAAAYAQTTQPDINQWIETLNQPAAWSGAGADSRKIAALHALAQQGESGLAALPAVVRLISDPAYTKDATDTLIALGPRVEPILLERLQAKPSGQDAALLVRALAAIDPHPAQLLVKLGGATDIGVRAAAVGELGRLGQDQLPNIIAVLPDPAPLVRQAAVDALRAIAPLPPSAYAAVQSALAAEKEPAVLDHIALLAAADAGLRLGLEPALIQAAHEGRFTDARFKELQRLGLGQPKTPAARAAQLGDTDPQVRAQACTLLAENPAQSLFVLPALIALVQTDPQESVRAAARQAIAAVLQEAQLSAAADANAASAFADDAVKLATDDAVDPALQETAFMALCAGAAQAPSALDFFVDATQTRARGPVAAHALLTLLMRQDPAVLDAFARRLHEARPALRLRLVALVAQGGPGAANIAASLIADPDPQTQALAVDLAQRLGIGNAAEVRALLTLIGRPGIDVDTKAQAVTALSAIILRSPALAHADTDIPNLMPVVRDLLSNPDRAVRGAADAVLLHFNPHKRPLNPASPSAGVLVRWLADPGQSSLTRVWACQQLPSVDVKAQRGVILAGLTAALKDKNAAVRAAAARTLFSFPRDAAAAVPALVQLARKDDDAQVRAAAEDALATLDDARAQANTGQGLTVYTAAEAAAVLADPKAAMPLRLAAMQVLAQHITEAALPSVMAALHADHFRIREAAIDVVVPLGAKGAPAVPLLIGLAQDWHAQTRAAAVAALVKIQPNGPPNGPAVWAALAAAVEDPDPQVQATAMQALPAAAGPDAAAGMPALISVAWARRADGQDAPLCAALAKLAAKLDAAGAAKPLPLPPDVQAALQDTDVHRRIDAFAFAASLGAAGRPALDAMLKAAVGQDPGLARQALSAMQQMGVTAPPAVPALIELSRKGPSPSRQLAAETLAVLGRGNPAALDRLREMANTDADPHLRARVTELLTAAGPGAAP